MKSNHQVWPGSFPSLHQLLPELMVEAPVCADVHSVFGPKGLPISCSQPSTCSHQVDGERFGIRFQTKQPHPPGYSQRPREELGADPPQRLPQVLVIRPLSPRVGPQICHVFTIYNGIQASCEISLESKEVIPAFDL